MIDETEVNDQRKKLGGWLIKDGAKFIPSSDIILLNADEQSRSDSIDPPDVL